jgi:ankyrin repeat protein
MHIASRGPNTGLVKEFLERGFDIDSPGHEMTRPSHYAAQHNRLTNGELLLDRGANIERVDEGGLTPLWHAAENGSAKFVQLLLDRGASIDMALDASGDSRNTWTQ